jgi:hypothetical protein
VKFGISVINKIYRTSTINGIIGFIEILSPINFPLLPTLLEGVFSCESRVLGLGSSMPGCCWRDSSIDKDGFTSAQTHRKQAHTVAALVLSAASQGPWFVTPLHCTWIDPFIGAEKRHTSKHRLVRKKS